MTHLHSFKDNGVVCLANIRMDNGDPVFVSVAQNGVVVKKSRVGFLGRKLFASRDVRHAADTTRALESIYLNRMTPPGMTNPILKAYSNAILQCSSVSQVAQVLNEAAKAPGAQTSS